MYVVVYNKSSNLVDNFFSYFVNIHISMYIVSQCIENAYNKRKRTLYNVTEYD